MWRAVAGVMAVVLGGATLAIVTGPAASAVHAQALTADVTCLGVEGYQVDWVLANRKDSQLSVTASSNAAVIAPGVFVEVGQAHSASAASAVPAAMSLTLDLTWADQTVETVTASVAQHDFPAHCGPNHVAVTLCHATPPDTAAQGWNLITIDDDAVVKEGHGYEHAADIIPPFVYWTLTDAGWRSTQYLGRNLDTLFAGVPGSRILNLGCALPPPGPSIVTPAAHKVDQQCVNGKYVDGAVIVQVTAGISYTIHNDGSGLVVPFDASSGSTGTVPPGPFTVSAAAGQGYELSDPNPIHLTVAAFTGPCGDLPTHPLVLPMVSIQQATCTSGASLTLADDLAETGAVIWTVNGAGAGEGTRSVSVPATITVSAAPAEGYGFGEGTTASWTFDFVAASGCELPTLAVTGKASPGWIAFSALLVIIGLVLLTFEGRDRLRAGRKPTAASGEDS